MELSADEMKDKIQDYLIKISFSNRQPSGIELLSEVEHNFGWKARFSLRAAIEDLIKQKRLSRIEIDYFEDLLDPDSEHSLLNVVEGQTTDNKVFLSTLDFLLAEGQKYRRSADFLEMIDFMARFKRYSPYNNMLVKIQKPHCSFYASQYDWKYRFERNLKEDARPMLILAPMHPVMLVYDLDSTEGKELPKRLLEFAHFDGEWHPEWLNNLTANANKYMIRISYRKHSSTSAGFATLERGNKSDKMRISIHDELDEPSKFGVLCHELAHIFLGHLGSDPDRWWPNRLNLNHNSVEIEAEAVAFTVTQRLGLKGSSIAYVSSYLTEDYIPEGISIDYIAKIAGKIEEMILVKIATPKRKSSTVKK